MTHTHTQNLTKNIVPYRIAYNFKCRKTKYFFIGSKKLCTSLYHSIQIRLIGPEPIPPVIKT